MDGQGALVMTPTRELALQIFDELRKVGKAHGYSAGLLIGGKSVKEEKRFVNGEPYYRLTLHLSSVGLIA
jgi:ATP-dependent RNA helicase DDX10/DBP4